MSLIHIQVKDIWIVCVWNSESEKEFLENEKSAIWNFEFFEEVNY